MGWQQYVLLVWFGCEAVYAIKMHGEPREPFNARGPIGV
jgi:hypothetical protein